MSSSTITSGQFLERQRSWTTSSALGFRPGKAGRTGEVVGEKAEAGLLRCRLQGHPVSP
ncbi:hypothetical protein [Streptomyces sp. NPDC059071]|uniref:hypothetical protein n=1 Tax=unclassified Streptomyces TaxID=2593676 RepID=UPI00365DD5E6